MSKKKAVALPRWYRRNAARTEAKKSGDYFINIWPDFRFDTVVKLRPRKMKGIRWDFKVCGKQEAERRLRQKARSHAV